MPRRRRPRRRRTNYWLILVQVLGLVAILTFILLFRDFIAESASNVVGSFGSDDVRVQSDEQGEDDGSERGEREEETDSGGDSQEEASEPSDTPSFKRVGDVVDAD